MNNISSSSSINIVQTKITTANKTLDNQTPNHHHILHRRATNHSLPKCRQARNPNRQHQIWPSYSSLGHLHHSLNVFNLIYSKGNDNDGSMKGVGEAVPQHVTAPLAPTTLHHQESGFAL
ncbi:hypothetical protein PIB30_075007 [Stylosanthes scabra]|uniref:Uncharacterized protein n=1 Tax=Stylosanthes scabra TaxID=79078 RepID=A0ABU6YNN3_9FABA|nr:hypothetical protein [Stylosanthes scabra]